MEYEQRKSLYEILVPEKTVRQQKELSCEELKINFAQPIDCAYICN